MYRYCELCEDWVHSDRHIIGHTSRLVKCGICGYPLRAQMTDDDYSQLQRQHQGKIPRPAARHLGSAHD